MEWSNTLIHASGKGIMMLWCGTPITKIIKPWQYGIFPCSNYTIINYNKTHLNTIIVLAHTSVAQFLLNFHIFLKIHYSFCLRLIKWIGCESLCKNHLMKLVLQLHLNFCWFFLIVSCQISSVHLVRQK